MPLPKLKPHEQIFVVKQLALFERPTAIQKALKELYNVEVGLPGIIYYDLSNAKKQSKWRSLFDETRNTFLEDTSSIAIANKAFRLKELDNLYHKQKEASPARQNTVEMRATLEQAAKESGNQFTNKTEVKVITNPLELLSELTGVDVEQLPQLIDNGDHS